MNNQGPTWLWLLAVPALALVLGLAWWIVSAVFFPRRKRGRTWWPVRPETVGRRLWPFVQPRAVGIMVVLQAVVLVAVFAPPPWPVWFEFTLYGLLFLALMASLYRIEVRGMVEGWVRYRPREETGPADRVGDAPP